MAISKKEYLEKLENAYNQWNGSEDMNRLIKIRGMFTPYSIFNKMLIYSQRRGAMICAGKNKWEEVGRHLNSGEYSNAIWIYAPIMKTVVRKVKDKNGNEKEEKTKIVTGFNPVRVYDISQTNGKDIESINDKIDGEDAQEIFDLVVDKLSEKYCITSHTLKESEHTVLIDDNTLSIMEEAPCNEKLYSIIYKLSKMMAKTDLNDSDVIAQISSSLFMSDLGIDISDTVVKKIALGNIGSDFEKFHSHITASTILVKKFEREFGLNRQYTNA